MSSVTETVTEMIQPILDQKGFYLVDLEYVKEGSSWYLRIYIDKPTGIDIEECALVNQIVSEKLDADYPDLIPNAYFLEVSSPGAERPLKTEADLQRAQGQYVHLSLYQKLAGQKVFEGTLTDLTEQELTLTYRVKTRVQTLTIPRKNIAAIRLAIEF
ncbi:ribosome maturation factor RimP [Lactobacillus sp. DCY120]|uniref:Ribosome maturation factor RimP n=1 Tax=Bombilactobacillus apium TaxID=2675299 RepID=A0A850R287_9LACO|nr:ribosome maturation factor RimP [Bombilactobacillus apium]NVY97033.1 ribosome maturation factor RimP [Bombilactobacillus apium]